MAQCTAKSKQSGQRCKRYATVGHNVCSIHGSKSLVGIAHPGLRSGRYSKHLPTRLGERYEAALKDPDLLALNHEIAITDAQINELLAQVEEDEPRTDNNEERLAWRVNQAAIRRDVQGLIESRRRLVETERKRLVDLQQMMSAEQAMMLLAAVESIVRKHVNDRNVLADISADIARLVAHQPRG